MDGEEQQIDGEVHNHEKKLNEKKKSWGKLYRPDSFTIEAGKTPKNTNHPSLMSWRTTLSLAFQSLGVVYGDIGTSPLYVYASTFTEGIHDKEDVIGVLSLIIYTITLVALLKYVFIVLQANDNGEGGTFALYSLICRYAKMGLIPNQEPEDRDLSNYTLELPTTQLRRAHIVKEKLENSKFAKIILFLVTIMGTSMVIGDGILTPSISVLSAVSGIKSLGQNTVVGVSVAILILLFAFQRFGTDKVGFSFAPIILVWFTFLTGIGLFNLFKHDITVLRALNPLYIIHYFRRTGKKGWISLGGVFLCITGTEAMFADLGHFSVRAVQISFSCVAYPALVTIYCGQAAYLTKHASNVSNTFYDSIPDPIYWPTFVVAVAASIIASQAMISGAFSVISQSLRMGCFPRVQVIHTSAKYEGQIYIPEINYVLMLACIAVTLAFRTTEKIGHAYGIAVVTVMVITTFMVTLIMLVIWKTNIVWIAMFLVVFGSIEMLYLSSVMYKFTSGGYLPLAITIVLMAMMAIWQYVHVLKYRYELREKISGETAIQMATNPDVNRVPGIGLFYTELVHGITPLFSHYISNLSSVHSVFVLISIKSLPINRVTSSERFFFRYVGPKDSGMFRCVVRYGYKEDIEEPDEFERQFVHHLKEFIHHEYFISGGGDADEIDKEEEPNVETTLVPLSSSVPSSGRIGSSHSSSSNKIRSARVVQVQSAEGQTEVVDKAREKGMVYLMGETEITAEKSSSLFKKFIVNHAYNFLKKNCREGDKALAIPRSKLLKVGMTYEL
ncbi:PREDICTED: potassium transporter 5-like [Camelina sativa]|uniref:Potassium transporter n=1 Tax=Camelina sativa TaxID=90675 RepID=A0ABM0V3H2_CAMSA|nr:PREDICTED: potassium transporter 5-like [Camelina sativa]